MKGRPGSRFTVLCGGLLLVVIGLFLPRLVLNLVIAPRADTGTPGWWAMFSGPSHPLPVNGYTTRLAPFQTVPLNPDFTRVTLWTVWRIPESGRYLLNYSAEARSRLAVDGRVVIEAKPRSQSRRIEREWVELERGPHLIRLELVNDQGGGWFSLGVMTPPLMRFRPLLDQDLSVVELGSLDTWWWVLRLCRPLVITGAILAGLAGLALLLPLSAGQHWSAVAATLVLVLVPALLIPDYSGREPCIGPMVHQRLREKKPRFVFIGNSMLWSRIDDQLLGKLVGAPVFSIVNFGAMSAIHYLALKYLLIPSGVKPDKVFVFFRGTTLLDPTFRTTGSYFNSLVERITPGPDPVFEGLAHGRTIREQGWLMAKLARIFRVQANARLARDMISRVALFLVDPVPGPEAARRRQAMRKRFNQRFGLKNVAAGMDRESLRKSRGVVMPAEFEKAVQNSFLPPMLALARENGFGLVFIRVQERPPAQGTVQDPPAMREFMTRLRRYLEENGAQLYDFTGDPALDISMYGQGDHIAEPTAYTPIFFDRLRGLLK